MALHLRIPLCTLLILFVLTSIAPAFAVQPTVKHSDGWTLFIHVAPLPKIPSLPQLPTRPTTPSEKLRALMDLHCDPVIRLFSTQDVWQWHLGGIAPGRAPAFSWPDSLSLQALVGDQWQTARKIYCMSGTYADISAMALLPIPGNYSWPEMTTDYGNGNMRIAILVAFSRTGQDSSRVNRIVFNSKREDFQ